MQIGNTCLFECLHYLNPARSVRDYINDLAPDQNVEEDGYYGTAAEVTEYVRANFDTKPMSSVPDAIKSGFEVLTSLPAEIGRHEIVIHGVDNLETRDPNKIKLLYFDPAYGKDVTISYLDFITGAPEYAIAIKTP